MKVENYNNVKIVIPSVGYKLTQKEDVETYERMICDKLVLGKYDSYDNYKEISNDEAEVILKAIEEYNLHLEEIENNELNKII